MEGYVLIAGGDVERRQKIREWYGRDFSLSDDVKDKALKITQLDTEECDPELMFQRIEFDCRVYLFDSFVKNSDETKSISNDFKKLLKDISKKTESILLLLGEGASMHLLAEQAQARKDDEHRRAEARSFSVGPDGLPECHHYFMSAHQHIFPTCNWHGLDPQGLRDIPDSPDYEFQSDKKLEEIRLMNISGTFNESYEESEFFIRIIEEHLRIVQHVQLSECYEAIRILRASVESMLSYMGRGRKGDASLGTLVRGLSSTFNLTIPDDKRKSKGESKCRTVGYTTKRNKEFIILFTKELRSYMADCRVEFSPELSAIDSSLGIDITSKDPPEIVRDHQNYYLNRARKSTNAHQLPPEFSDE